MMHRLQNPEPKTSKPARMEPVAEGPAKPAGRRSWGRMSDAELVAHAKEFIAERGTTGRTELQKADSGLYNALKRRKLLDEVGLPDSRGERRDWAGMEREELVARSKEYITETLIGGRKELKRADPGLYQALRKRKLLGEVGLAEKHRDWAGMERGEFVSIAKGFISERRIGSRVELEKADGGLYQALRRRKLLDEVGLAEKYRDWAGMGRDELVAFSKGYISENGITTKSELFRADACQYNVLRIMKLLDEVGLEEKRRDWTGMGKTELIAHARDFIRELGIGTIGEMGGADSRLYKALRRRGLLRAIFSDIDSSNHADAVAGVLNALDSFGDEK